jgi:hypothetical protein
MLLFMFTAPRYAKPRGTTPRRASPCHANFWNLEWHNTN